MLHTGKPTEMKLTTDVLRNFKVAKVFRENTDRINKLDFSANGETLISSSDDDSIVIYDCQSGTWVQLSTTTRAFKNSIYLTDKYAHDVSQQIC